MFTGLHEENWILRLSEEDREEIKALGALPFEPMGRAMKQYILIPQAILQNSQELHEWIQRSLTYVGTLPASFRKSGSKKVNPLSQAEWLGLEIPCLVVLTGD